ncbi:phosphoribosylamine--glycine ligase [Magnetofaba australis]|uniref:Phosphoribosylamine--glycine ligase n=1 Tax=Magnetofaba australis IT-1 TaxID=1434232 RepID=A0A1Y2JYR1_9PROT|nr:phosphoribosylamine--glycine ligase [Magnetofaba australis]OSM00025.1 putative phosphoribosylamine--glycine ligase [Magnetofaba australis IT-1]
MNILVVGGGGREHALVWKIAQSELVEKIYCAPGNPGIAQHAECVNISVDDVHALTEFAVQKDIDLTVIGPELPLVLGLADALRARGLLVFGPSKAAAEIEGSKAFMKSLFAKYNIPTAEHRTFSDAEAAKAYVGIQGAPIVIKASGLAAGKGAVVCQTISQAMDALDRIMVKREFGDAGDEVVVEEFLAGEEASFLAIVDGETVVPLAGSQDHKAVGEGDTGPNTGGMGAYSPAPVLDAEMVRRAMDQVMLPTARAMVAEGRPFQGILYAGLMIDDGRIKTLEFNARFGDPECQPLLMRMKSDLVPVLLAAARGELEGQEIEWDERAAVCVVMASNGYPNAYEKGQTIDGLDAVAEMEDCVVFHAGTKRQNGRIINDGGRVLGVTALGKGVTGAREAAYAAVRRIEWKEAYYRRDIGHRAVAREEEEAAELEEAGLE